MHRFMNHLDDLAGLDVVLARHRRTAAGEAQTRRTGLLARLRDRGDQRTDIVGLQEGVERCRRTAAPTA